MVLAIVLQHLDPASVSRDNMEKKDYDIIFEQITNLKNLPNNKLVDWMDKLSSDFETKKAQIINLTLELDNAELLYNSILKEFQNRNNK